MSSVTLHTNDLSQPSRAAEMLAKLVDAPYEKAHVDFGKGEHQAPEYLAKFWAGKIPALSDGDFHISESVAMAEYIASKVGGSEKYFPTDPQKRARVNEYLHWHHSGTRKGVSGWFFQKYLVPVFFDQAVDQQKVEETFKDLISTFETLNKKLEGKLYLAGDELTFADILAVNEISEIVEPGLFKLDDYANLKAWYERSRDALQPHFDSLHGDIRGLAETFKNAEA